MLITHGLNDQEIFLRNPEVDKITGTRSKQRRRYEAAGTFPKSIKLASRTRVWLKSDIDRWMADKIAGAAK